MRTLLVTLASLLILAVAAPAQAATAYVIKIEKNGFSPSNVTVTAGDTVTWTNADRADHQVVATSGAFASPVLRPRQSYSFTFPSAGRYDYRDGLQPRLTGRVSVQDPPPAVSLTVSAPQVVFGQTVTLSGTVNNGRAGEQVVLLAQPYGQPSQIVLVTVITNPGGSFSYVTKPSVLTAYTARWKTAASPPVAPAVAPKVSFGRSGAFVTRVFAGRSFVGRTVQLQRLSRYGQWVTIGLYTLNDRSAARFRKRLPMGLSRLRIAMSVNQLGPGYLAAFSPTILFRRKA